jgi:hypothetical protein
MWMVVIDASDDDADADGCCADGSCKNLDLRGISWDDRVIPGYSVRPAKSTIHV